jgi:peptide/nickel transport system permease protein
VSATPFTIPRRRAFPRMSRGSRAPIAVIIAALILAVVLVLVVLGGTLAPQDPRAQDLMTGLQPPSGEHLLGTDALGRDVLSRIMAGARPATLGAGAIAVIAVIVGTLVGLLAGLKGGRLDKTVVRLIDFGIAFPSTLVALIVAGVTDGGYAVGVLVLAVLFAPYDIRFLRAAVLEQRRRPYVEAARTLGRPDRTIMFRHVLPNIRPMLVTYMLLDFAYALVGLSSLSYLGVGVPPGAADWGRMLAENLAILPTNPVGSLAPAAMLVLTAVSLNLLGDWVQDRYIRKMEAA